MLLSVMFLCLQMGVILIEELLEWKSSGSDLENRD
jgi:hypothetical protein